MLPKKFRLKKRSAFAATYRSGKSFHKGGITIFAGKKFKQVNSGTITKIGFVVSKRIHKRAVKRNRVKRLMRESVRLYIKSLEETFKTDYMSLIFVASPKLLEKDFKYINKYVLELMELIND